MFTPGQDDQDDLIRIDEKGLPLIDPQKPADVPRTDDANVSGSDGVVSDAPAKSRPSVVTIESGIAAADDALDDDCMPLDDELEQIGFELFDWQADELDSLDDALHEISMPHEWESDGLELVVHLRDESAVEAMLPKVRYPDELPAEHVTDDTDMEVLGLLFVAADRVVRDPTGEGVTNFLDAAERLADAPYGVDPKLWEIVVEAVDNLIDAFHGAAPIEDIIEQAERLRSGLRPLV